MQFILQLPQVTFIDLISWKLVFTDSFMAWILFIESLNIRLLYHFLLMMWYTFKLMYELAIFVNLTLYGSIFSKPKQKDDLYITTGWSIPLWARIKPVSSHKIWIEKCTFNPLELLHITVKKTCSFKLIPKYLILTFATLPYP